MSDESKILSRNEFASRAIDAANGFVQSREYAHLLVNLIHAHRIKCVLCEGEFLAFDPVTRCPNSATHSHSLIPIGSQATPQEKPEC